MEFFALGFPRAAHAVGRTLSRRRFGGLENQLSTGQICNSRAKALHRPFGGAARGNGAAAFPVRRRPAKRCGRSRRSPGAHFRQGWVEKGLSTAFRDGWAPQGDRQAAVFPYGNRLPRPMGPATPREAPRRAADHRFPLPRPIRVTLLRSGRSSIVQPELPGGRRVDPAHVPPQPEAPSGRSEAPVRRACTPVDSPSASTCTAASAQLPTRRGSAVPIPSAGRVRRRTYGTNGFQGPHQVAGACRFGSRRGLRRRAELRIGVDAWVRIRVELLDPVLNRVAFPAWPLADRRRSPTAVEVPNRRAERAGGRPTGFSVRRCVFGWSNDNLGAAGLNVRGRSRRALETPTALPRNNGCGPGNHSAGGEAKIRSRASGSTGLTR